MKKLALFAVFLASLALSSFVGVDEARAVEPAGHSFCKDGIGPMPEFIQRMEQALAADPEGKRVKVPGCYATPEHFLIAFQEANPEAGLTNVSQLPAYLGRLVPTEVDRTVEYQSSCIRDRANGGTVVVMGCVTRKVRRGEVIYSDPVTGKRVLWSSCANPGFAESMDVVVAAERCIAVRFPSMGQGAAIRGAYIGTRPLPGRCHSLQLAGEAERRYDFPEECPNIYERVVGDRRFTVVCDWRAIESNSTRLFRRPMSVQNVSYSFYAREEGTNVWYLPPEALEGLPTICWELPDGSVRALSVGRNSFVDGVATITEADVRRAVWR